MFGDAYFMEYIEEGLYQIEPKHQHYLCGLIHVSLFIQQVVQLQNQVSK